MKFSVCIPDFDETAWHWVDDDKVDDAEDAAEHHAKHVCSRDNESYASFEGEGLVVLVRAHGRSGLTVAVNVTMEMEPIFRARVLK